MTKQEIEKELEMARKGLKRLEEEYKDNEILLNFYKPSIVYLIDYYETLLNEN